MALDSIEPTPRMPILQTNKPAEAVWNNQKAQSECEKTSALFSQTLPAIIGFPHKVTSEPNDAFIEPLAYTIFKHLKIK